MSAQPQPQQQYPLHPPQYTPPRQGRAHYTMPMDYHRPLDANTQFQTRNICGRCNGLRVIPGEEMRCKVCGRHWSKEYVDKYGRRKGFANRLVELPCGPDYDRHTVLGRDIIWTQPRCDICHGEGLLERWVSWQELLDAYADPEDEQTTATLHIVAQHSGSYNREAFAQSGPTTPPVHISARPAPAHINPVSPHMTPLAPMPRQTQPVPPTPRFLEALGNGNLSGEESF